jgi:hypothetical protein
MLCETATFYIQTNVCVLYQERYGLGRLVTVTDQTASMISLNYRNPSGNVNVGYHDTYFSHLDIEIRIESPTRSSYGDNLFFITFPFSIDFVYEKLVIPYSKNKYSSSIQKNYPIFVTSIF